MDTEKELILIDKPAVSELFGNPKKVINTTFDLRNKEPLHRMM